MNLQHLNVKIFTEKSAEEIPMESYIPIFHSWIQKKVTEEMLLDVADYAHVPEGPGVMLIGHHANVSMDEVEGRLGLLYNRKVKEEGTNAEKLKRVFRWAYGHAKRLENEASVKGKLKFKPGSLQVTVNDRLLGENNEVNAKILESELEKLIAGIFGECSLKISRPKDPRSRLSLYLEIDSSQSLEDILKKL